MGDLTRHFSAREFTCAGCTEDKPCGRTQIPPAASLLEILEIVRRHYGQPVTINSGYRCEEHNATLPNSSPRSQHTRSRAADFWVKDVSSDEVYAWLHSWHRGGLGQYPGRTHVDTRPGYARWEKR